MKAKNGEMIKEIIEVGDGAIVSHDISNFESIFVSDVQLLDIFRWRWH